MLCGLGVHRSSARVVWNGSLGFSVCTRCGCELVRKPGKAWAPVPRGYKVVWRPAHAAASRATPVDRCDWSKAGSWFPDAHQRSPLAVATAGSPVLAGHADGDANWRSQSPVRAEVGNSASSGPPAHEQYRPPRDDASSSPAPGQFRQAPAKAIGIFRRLRDYIGVQVQAMTPTREPASRGFRYLARQIGALRQANEPASTILLSSACSPATANETMMMFAAMLQDELGGRVLIVDGTLRSDGISQALGLPGRIGLSEAGALQPQALLDAIHALPRPLIALMTAGQHPASAQPANLASLLPLLSTRYDHILIQQRAIIADTRYLPIAAAADMVLVIAEEGVSRMRELTECRKAFQAHGIDRVGVLLSIPSAKAAPANGPAGPSDGTIPEAQPL